MRKNSITAHRLWIACAIAFFLSFPLLYASQKVGGRFIGIFFTIGWLLSWSATGIVGSFALWAQNRPTVFAWIPQWKWSKIGLLSFLCGVNGLFVSTMLLGRCICDCCEKEHPQAKKSYPLLDANPIVSHFVQTKTAVAMFAGTLAMIAAVSTGLFFFSFLIFSLRFHFWLIGTFSSFFPAHKD